MSRLLRTLFSGGCLFDVGARAAGYTHLDGYEIDAGIAAVAQQNGFDVRVADVCDVDYASQPFANHLHVSPSCKNASQANQKGRDENGDPLPRETPADLAAAGAVGRAIAAHQGETFTLENVWGYRTFESFEIIRQALREAGFSFDYWHLCAADYGVPQTRRRLILVARRGLCRIQRPHPTHREGGDMFHPPWVGWYAAIADILHTLPPTKPAPWQEARMPKELRESTLFPSRMSHDQHGNCYGPQSRGADEPAQTVATMTPGWYKAWLVESKNSNQQYGDGLREMHEPATTVVTDPKPSHQPKAYIVASNSNPVRDGVYRPDEEPAHTVTTNAGGRVRALLIDGQTGSYGTNMTARNGDDPAFTIRANSNARQAVRALVPSGRWVRMTIQALGRFQTVPDDYIGLTSEINGNGVPCLLAQRIMESL